jgi:hypothetical protein
MSTTAKHMLLSAISQHGNYQEKQLAKSGEVGACAASIIKRLRRNVRLYHCLIVAFPACLVIRQVVAWVFSPDQPTSWSFLAWNGLIPLTLLPSLITQHVSLSKFETIVAMWLYTNSDETDHRPSHTDTELAKLVASTF